ncbi:DUF4065 domain-containing protein [bacterium]|nr:MAG: DUF4065 domain-containing protein [bacterium]
METGKPATVHYAKTVVGAFTIKGELITHLKLQKILYFIQGWHLAYFNSDPFNEAPEAWIHGPVYVSAYQEYRKFGFNPITIELPEEVVLEQLLLELPEGKNDNILEFLTELLDHYGSKSAFELELITHNQDPWVNARKGCGPGDRSTKVMDLTEIHRYFKAQLEPLNAS